MVFPVPAGPHRMMDGRLPSDEYAGERLALPHQMPLPDELLEGARAHPGGERLIAHRRPTSSRGRGRAGSRAGSGSGPPRGVHRSPVYRSESSSMCSSAPSDVISTTVPQHRDGWMRVRLVVDRHGDARVPPHVLDLRAAVRRVQQDHAVAGVGPQRREVRRAVRRSRWRGRPGSAARRWPACSGVSSVIESSLGRATVRPGDAQVAKLLGRDPRRGARQRIDARLRLRERDDLRDARSRPPAA